MTVYNATPENGIEHERTCGRCGDAAMKGSRFCSEHTTIATDGGAVPAQSDETLRSIASETTSTVEALPDFDAWNAATTIVKDTLTMQTDRRHEPEPVDWDSVHAEDRGPDASIDEAEHVAGPEEEILTDGGETGDDLPPLHVGDHVTDRDDDDDAPMLVVGLDTLQAGAYELGDGGPTVAEVYPDHPETDDVVEVIFPNRTDMDVDKKRYAYPRARLELEQPIHDRDDDSEASE